MSLELDKRQRAMLREMGVNLWWAPSPEARSQAQPEAASAPSAPALPSEAMPPMQTPLSSIPPAAPPVRQLPPGLVPASSLASAPPRPRKTVETPAAVAPPAELLRASGDAAPWQVGEPQLLAGEGLEGEAPVRWLLLAEGRPEELADGAGELLQNMLRAARLHQEARVWLAPLQRAAGAASVQGLDEVLARTEPDVVFVMSRLGAQALLETDQPLGRLRGQVHDLWGLPAVVSYDPGALLRTPTEKGKAWDDLCLALQVARAQHAERLASQ